MSTLQQSQVSQLKLHGVLALTSPSRGVLGGSANVLATAANSFVAIHDTSTGQQVQQLRSTTSNQPVHCVALSACGTVVAAGEAGANPSVVIWSIASGHCDKELKAHKHTVSSLCFSSDGKLLASVGCAADGQLCIWDWRAGALLCKQKVAADLPSVAFTEDNGSVLVAGSKGFLKSWSLSSRSSPRAIRRRSSTGGGAASSDAASGSITLKARAVTLKQQHSSSFVDVCLAPCLPGQPVGSNGVYALADSGHLLLLRSTGRTVDRSVDLQVRAAFGLAATPTLVACACSQGTVRILASKTLAFKANLPYLGAAGVAASITFADARGCTFCGSRQVDDLLAVVYSSQEVVIWDMQDLAQIQPVRSFSSHASSIWDVCPFSMPAACTEGGSTSDNMSGCATCSSDGTIRFWATTQTGQLQPLQCLAAGAQPASSSSGSGKKPPKSSTTQLRCIRISSDGQLLATGDTAGNVHVYDVPTLKLLVVQEAHDSDVLCLDFSPPPDAAAAAAPAAAQGALNKASTASSRRMGGRGLAASGSSDMLIHVYDASNGFRLLETLDDHEAAVTALRFMAGGRGLVSMSEHSLIFRMLGSSFGGAFGFQAVKRLTLQHSLLHGLVVDPLGSYALTCDQAGTMQQWDPTDGTLQRCMQPEVGAGRVERLCMDPGGVLAICCSSDGCTRLYDVRSGQLKWRGWGHSSQVTAAAVTPDLRQLVSVGRDGCILNWTLPDSLVEELQAAALDVAAQQQQQQQQQQGHVPVAPLQHSSPGQQGGTAAASPAAASTAALQRDSLSTPQGQAQLSRAGGSSSSKSQATPHSATSEGGGISSTLRRLKQGKPLVSADKLPRWARSPSSGSTAQQERSPTHDPDTKTRAQQQPKQRVSKWLTQWAAQPGSSNEAAAAVAPSPAQAEGLHEEQQQQQQLDPQLLWHPQHSRVLIRHWSDGSSFAKEAAAMAAAAAATTVAVYASDTMCGEAPSASPEHVGGVDVCDAEAEQQQQQDLPEKLQASPQPQGAGAVVRDLFKSHFRSLRGVKAPEAAEEGDDCLSVQPDRHSFSARFKEGRSSESQVDGPQTSTGAAAVPVPAGTASSSAAGAETIAAEDSTGLTPQGSKLFRAPSDPQQLPALSAAEEAEPGAQQQLHSQEPSPREKRWRQGQMQPELAGMWERLESLQAQFQQQQEAARTSPMRPARPNSSLGHASPAKQQQQQQARIRGCSDGGSSSSPQQPAPAAEEVPPLALQPPQQQQSQQQQVRPAKSPVRCAAAPGAAAQSPKSPGVFRSRLHAAPGDKQACASPAAAGSAAKALRRARPSPAKTASPGVVTARTQQPTVPGRIRRSPRAEGSPAAAFGSRTMSSLQQRRRSSNAGDSAATGAAAEKAAVPGKQSSSGRSEPASPAAAAAVGAPASAAVPPVACGPASPQATAGSSGLLAELLQDESPVPTPGATAAVAEEAAQGSCGAERTRIPRSPAAGAAAAAALRTPQGPNANARLAELLAWDSSPEGSTPGHASPPAAPSGPETQARQHSSQGQPAMASQLHLDGMLPQSSSCSPSPEPMQGMSPDRQRLQGPLTAAGGSPQLWQKRQGQGRRAERGAAASPQAAKRLLGPTDVASECRVSIGTSIAARSPAAAAAAMAAAGAAGPAATANPGGSVSGKAAAAAVGAPAAASYVRCGSVDLTPVPASGVTYMEADTPKVTAGTSLAAAASAAAGVQQQQQVPPSSAEVLQKSCVTVTPTGGTTIWPAWGQEGAWELTPEPADDPEQSGNSSTSAGPLPACGSAYWVQQNPIYDMSPHGSAGRNSKGLGAASGAAEPTLPSSLGNSPAGSLQAHPVVGGSPTHVGGSGHATPVPASPPAPAAAGGASEQQPSTPVSAGGSSGYGSEPGSVSSSKTGGGGKWPGSGGRFSSRSIGSLLGRGHSSKASPSKANSDSSRPPSPGAGMLGLLQRMKLTRSRKSSTSSTAGGSRVTGDSCEGLGDEDSLAGNSAIRQQQQQQSYGHAASTGGSGVSAGDVQVEVSCRSVTSTAKTPIAAAAAAAGAARSGTQPLQGTAAEVAATVEHFKHSMHEMRDLLLKLQGLSIDEDSSVELTRQLTPPPKQARSRTQSVAAGGSPQGAGPVAGEQQQEVGSTCSSNSSSVPPVSLQQQLQREVLSSISELHAAITGLPLSQDELLGSGGDASVSMRATGVAGATAAGARGANAAGQSLLPAMQAGGVGAAVAEPVVMQQLSARISELVLQQLHDLQQHGGLVASQPGSNQPSRGGTVGEG